MLCFRRIISLGPWRCRLKHLFEFAQRLGARESWIGDPRLAAGRDVQHPERHFQNPRCLDVFQGAVRHRSAAFYESDMHPYCPPIPWMPGITDFTEIPDMGVVLLSCSIRNATIRAKATPCSSPPHLRLRLAGTSAVENALVACFDITVGRLEYFGPTRNWVRICGVGAAISDSAKRRTC